MNAAIQAQLTGASQTVESSRSGENFTGPDGNTYQGTFYAPDAFVLASQGLDMAPNGFPDKTVISFTCTRAQFAAVPGGIPSAWKGKKIIRTAIAPVQTVTIAHMTTDDPLYFGFVGFQVQAPRGV